MLRSKRLEIEEVDLGAKGMEENERRRGFGAGDDDRLLELCFRHELDLLTGDERHELEALLAEGDEQALEALARARDLLGAVALGAEPRTPRRI